AIRAPAIFRLPARRSFWRRRNATVAVRFRRPASIPPRRPPHAPPPAPRHTDPRADARAPCRAADSEMRRARERALSCYAHLSMYDSYDDFLKAAVKQFYDQGWKSRKG